MLGVLDNSGHCMPFLAVMVMSELLWEKVRE